MRPEFRPRPGWGTDWWVARWSWSAPTPRSSCWRRSWLRRHPAGRAEYPDREAGQEEKEEEGSLWIGSYRPHKRCRKCRVRFHCPDPTGHHRDKLGGHRHPVPTMWLKSARRRRLRPPGWLGGHVGPGAPVLVGRG